MDASLTEQPCTLEDRVATHIGDRLPRGTRVWFAFFILWQAVWAGAAWWVFEMNPSDDGLAVRLWLLALMCFYLSLCNSFCPLPTAWIVLLTASPEYAVIDNGPLRVLLVAGLATASTVVANLNEYHLLAYLLHFGLGRRVQQTRLYGWATRWFDRAPFQILTGVAFVPIPVDAIRWLAILRRYSRLRFVGAYFLGRGARYVLFAWFAVWFRLTGGQIVAIQLGLLALTLGARVVWQYRQRRVRSCDGHSAQFSPDSPTGAGSGSANTAADIR